VTLAHGSSVRNVLYSFAGFDAHPSNISVSFLPLCHVTARHVDLGMFHPAQRCFIFVARTIKPPLPSAATTPWRGPCPTLAETCILNFDLWTQTLTSRKTRPALNDGIAGPQ
jgi:hypothetical protein